MSIDMDTEKESVDVGELCAKLTKESLAKAKARAKNGPGKAEINDSCNGLMRHMTAEASAGKNSAMFQIGDETLCKAVFTAAKKWKGCTMKLVNNVIIAEW